MQINIDLMQITIDSQPPFASAVIHRLKKKNTTSFASAVITVVYNGFPESLVDATNSQKSVPYHCFFFIRKSLSMPQILRSQFPIIFLLHKTPYIEGLGSNLCSRFQLVAVARPTFCKVGAPV